MSEKKHATSQVSWALVMEGVVAARLETHRIRQLLNRALQVVGNSPHKDEIYQRAGDIIVTLPRRLTQLDTLLDRTSYALASQGKDFLYSHLSLEDRKLVDDSEDAVALLPPGTSKTKKQAWSQQPGDLAGVRTFVDEPSVKDLPSEHIDQAIGPHPGPKVEYFSRPEMNKGKPETTRLMPEPGEEYGHPWKEDVVKRRTMTASAKRVAFRYVAKRQRKLRNPAKIRKYQMKRRRNPSKVKEQLRWQRRYDKAHRAQKRRYLRRYRQNPERYRRIACVVASRYLGGK